MASSRNIKGEGLLYSKITRYYSLLFSNNSHIASPPVIITARPLAQPGTAMAFIVTLV